MGYNTRQREEREHYGKDCFVINEEVIDVFNNKCHIPTIINLSFHLDYVSILGIIYFGKTRNDYFW